MTEIPEGLLSYPPLLAGLLLRRGVDTSEAALRFLNPDYVRDIADPFGIIDMDKAVERILRAIAQEEKIVVFGDYDCDGIPGSVILHDFFQKIGYAHMMNYIPHRHTEGYGLSMSAIDAFAKDGVALVVTVDCGITDVAEVDHAATLGIDVVITDHHLPQEILPRAVAVVNSKREGDTYADKMLCGAAVAWKLTVALLRKGKERNMPGFGDVPDGWEKWLLDMAGLSTIADMVPLAKENRVIAKFGLEVLRRSPRPGLRSLLSRAGVDQRRLTEEDVGFTIAPRINAASRMDIPFKAFRMLASRDEGEAIELADFLTTLNDERKGEVARMMKEARGHLEDRTVGEVIVIGSPRWRVGIVGLAAGKLAEEYDKPAFVWGREGSVEIKGSCRSNGSVNMVELMAGVEEGIFIDFGGHEESGGFSVASAKVHLLEDALARAYREALKKEKMRAGTEPEETLPLSVVSDETVRILALVAPFGIGNPRPVFRFLGVTIEKVEKFGKGKEHLRLTLSDDTRTGVEAIAFFKGPDDFTSSDVVMGASVTLDGHIEESWFRGRRSLRLRILDIR